MLPERCPYHPVPADHAARNRWFDDHPLVDPDGPDGPLGPVRCLAAGDPASKRAVLIRPGDILVIGGVRNAEPEAVADLATHLRDTVGLAGVIIAADDASIAVDQNAAALDRVRQVHRPDADGNCTGCGVDGHENPIPRAECATLAALAGVRQP